MSNQIRGTLYIDITSDLPDRTWKHRAGSMEGFTKRYGLKTLVWYEPHEEMIVAIQRERSLKRWPRHWKIKLIERDNPDPASRVATIIYEGCSQLKDFPNRGRQSSRMPGRRELPFPPLPYVAIYEVKNNAVEISRIFHGAQNWP